VGLFLALVTYFGWGTGDIFGVIATRKIGAYKATFFIYLFGFLVASLYVPFALPEFSKITFGLFLINFFLGSTYLIGNFLINEAFKSSSPSLVGIIVQSFPAIVLILSALIFKDPVTVRQMLWIVIVFIGMFLCTINISDFTKGKIVLDKGIKYALIAAGIFSIGFTFMRVFIDVYGWFWPNYIAFASFPFAILVIKYLFKIKEKIVFPKNKSVVFAVLLSALLLRAGDIALNAGISSGYASVVAPIAGASPTLFVAISSILFKDPISTQQKFGIFVSLLGIILLSFFSG
jgi:drug/metabolite transporter (DMT)-like permease